MWRKDPFNVTLSSRKILKYFLFPPTHFTSSTTSSPSRYQTMVTAAYLWWASRPSRATTGRPSSVLRTTRCWWERRIATRLGTIAAPPSLSSTVSARGFLRKGEGEGMGESEGKATCLPSEWRVKGIDQQLLFLVKSIWLQCSGRFSSCVYLSYGGYEDTHNAMAAFNLCMQVFLSLRLSHQNLCWRCTKLNLRWLQRVRSDEPLNAETRWRKPSRSICYTVTSLIFFLVSLFVTVHHPLAPLLRLHISVHHQSLTSFVHNNETIFFWIFKTKYRLKTKKKCFCCHTSTKQAYEQATFKTQTSKPPPHRTTPHHTSPSLISTPAWLTLTYYIILHNPGRSSPPSHTTEAKGAFSPSSSVRRQQEGGLFTQCVSIVLWSAVSSFNTLGGLNGMAMIKVNASGGEWHEPELLRWQAHY